MKANPRQTGVYLALLRDGKARRGEDETTQAAQTINERQRAFRQRQQEAGLKEIRNLWAKPEHHEQIKALAAKLANSKKAAS